MPSPPPGGRVARTRTLGHPVLSLSGGSLRRTVRRLAELLVPWPSTTDRAGEPRRGIWRDEDAPGKNADRPRFLSKLRGRYAGTLLERAADPGPDKTDCGCARQQPPDDSRLYGQG